MRKTDAKRLVLAWLSCRLEYEWRKDIEDLAGHFGEESSTVFGQLSEATSDIKRELLRRARRRTFSRSIRGLLRIKWWDGHAWVSLKSDVTDPDREWGTSRYVNAERDRQLDAACHLLRQAASWMDRDENPPPDELTRFKAQADYILGKVEAVT